MDPDATMAAELHQLRWCRDDILGAVLAGRDGMLIAGEVPGVDPHHIAALAATSLGIGQRFTDTLGQGALREYVLRAASGCVISYPAGGHALLTVVAQPETDLVGLHPEARAAAQRLGTLFDACWQPATDPPPPEPPTTLDARTPMAALPAALRNEFSLRRPPNFA